MMSRTVWRAVEMRIRVKRLHYGLLVFVLAAVLPVPDGTMDPVSPTPAEGPRSQDDPVDPPTFFFPEPWTLEVVTLDGYTEAELTDPGFDYTSVVPPEYLSRLGEAHDRRLRGEPINSVESVLLTKDRSWLNVVITIRLINLGGGKAILGFITDV